MLTRFLCAAWLAAAAVLCVPSVARAQEPIALEDFAADASLRNPKLSPSGDKIAAIVRTDGVERLIVLSLTGGAPATFALEPEIDLNGYSWITDDWLAVRVGQYMTVEGDRRYVRRLAGMNAALTEFVKVDWAQSGANADTIIHRFGKGSTKVLLSKQTGFGTWETEFYSVYEADIATGKASKVLGQRDFVYNWYADPTGKIRLGRGHNFRSGEDFALYRKADSGGFKWINLEKDDTRVPQAFLDNDTALVFSDHEGFSAVYAMNIEDFSLGEKLFGVEGYDVETLLVNDDDSGLLGAQYVTTGPRYQWYDAALKSAQELLDNNVGPGRAHIISWNEDRSRLVLRIGGADEAGKYMVWDRSGAPRLIGYRNAALKDRKLNPVRSIRYQARDGVEIEAVMTLPRRRAHEKLPLIVLPHGGPGARDSEGYDWWTQSLAELGYAVIQPNYRGSTGYGTEFRDLGAGEWGLKMQDDLLDAIAWMADEGLADKERVCIVGASYGGYAALRGAQRDGAHYRCAISFAGVADLKKMMTHDRYFLIGAAASDYWKEQAANMKDVSPLRHAEDFAIPVLLVHGKRDVRVPVEQSRDMADALRHRGKDVTYIEQPEGDHHFSRTEDKVEFLRAMRDFLARHNPA